MSSSPGQVVLSPGSRGCTPLEPVPAVPAPVVPYLSCGGGLNGAGKIGISSR